MQSVGILFPWQNSKLGNITIEDIIKKIRFDDSLKEWKQTVTGFKLAFIRHPEFEFFSNNSVHWKAGAACADCHMAASARAVAALAGQARGLESVVSGLEVEQQALGA